ncbi:15895_t:CDS:1, partial [Acaulospora morrowiae]
PRENYFKECNSSEWSLLGGGHNTPISVASQSNIAHGKSLFATLLIMPTYMDTLRRKELMNWHLCL